MDFVRRHLTYANVLSLVVILLATGGTATAAVKRYSGKQIKDSSLTGIDFRDRSLERRDLSAAAITSLTGRRGATGATGAAGGQGPKGQTGSKGDMGKQSHSLVRYAYYYSPLLMTNPSATPNPGAKAWDASDYPSYGAQNLNYPNFTDNFPNLDQPKQITSNEPVVLQLTGSGQQYTTGTIRPTGPGLLTATATITVLHKPRAETLNQGDGMKLHGRMRCQLRYANNGSAITASSPTLGTTEWISTGRSHRVTTITMTGSEKVSATSTSNYNVGISCSDVDQTDSTQWMFVGGNITAHAVWVGA
jgi:hypothetical protein